MNKKYLGVLFILVIFVSAFTQTDFMEKSLHDIKAILSERQNPSRRPIPFLRKEEIIVNYKSVVLEGDEDITNLSNKIFQMNKAILGSSPVPLSKVGLPTKK